MLAGPYVQTHLRLLTWGGNVLAVGRDVPLWISSPVARGSCDTGQRAAVTVVGDNKKEGVAPRRHRVVVGRKTKS